MAPLRCRGVGRRRPSVAAPQRCGAPAFRRPATSRPSGRDPLVMQCSTSAPTAPLRSAGNARVSLAGYARPLRCAGTPRCHVPASSRLGGYASDPQHAARIGQCRAFSHSTAPRSITVARPRPRCSSRPARPGSQSTTCPRPWSITRPLMARTRRCAPDPDPWGTTSVAAVICGGGHRQEPSRSSAAGDVAGPRAHRPGSPGRAAHLPRASSSASSPASTASTRRFVHGVTERTPARSRRCAAGFARVSLGARRSATARWNSCNHWSPCVVKAKRCNVGRSDPANLAC